MPWVGIGRSIADHHGARAVRSLLREVGRHGTAVGIAHHVHGFLHFQAIEDGSEVRHLRIHAVAAPSIGTAAVADEVRDDEVVGGAERHRVARPHGRAGGDPVYQHQLRLAGERCAPHVHGAVGSGERVLGKPGLLEFLLRVARLHPHHVA